MPCRTYAAIAFVLLAACARSKSPSEFKYEERTFEKTLPGCQGPGDAKAIACVTFRVTYPEITDGVDMVARTAINTQIKKELLFSTDPQGFIAQAENLIKAYADRKREFPETKYSFYDRRAGRIVHYNAAAISISFARDEFDGGAHPNAKKIYRNYRLDDGKPIAIGPLLADGAAGKLLALAEVKVRQLRKIPEGVKLSEAGYFDDKLKPTENFAFGGGRLTLRWDDYEIAPHSTGPTEVEIPYAELGGLFKPEARGYFQ
jgi:hypothetical protein